MMRARFRPFLARGAAVVLLASLAAACSDFLAPPAEGSAQLAISYSLDPLAPRAQVGVERAFSRADRLRVRLTRAGTPVLDTTFAVAPEPGVIRKSFRIPLEESREDLELTAELLWGEHALFAGTRAVQVRRGSRDTAEVRVLPVPAEVRVAAMPVVEAIGDTVPLVAVALFATGDTVPGVPVEWATQDPAVGQLIPGGRMVALAEGTVRLTASSGGLSGAGAVQVRGRVTSVTVTPAADTVVVSDTLRLRATPRDRRGNPLAGRTVAWSSGGAAASVNPGGLVTGTAPGSAVISASVEGQTGQSTVAVVAAGRIYGRVRDLQTLAPVAGSALTLTEPGGGSRPIAVAADGRYSVDGLRPGNYTLSATAPGHGGNTAALRVVRLQGGDVVQIGFDLPATAAGQQVGGVAGRVLDPEGTPIGGATVMISGGARTNGVFKSVLTAADGTYTLPGISLSSSNGQAIPAFTVLAAANGRQTGRRDSLVVAARQTLANVDFRLAPGGTVQTFFGDGFETGFAWQVSGLWNRTTGTGIVNTAVPSQAHLAPDDTTAARLPTAPEGTRYLWYGNPAAGNYLGTGTHEGIALSPAFVIPAGTAVASLSFRTWFEIESVNPAAFDHMEVSIVDVAAGTTHRVALLNPVSDPNVANRNAIPMTSGGFNRAPVVRPVSLDVSQFTGRQIRIAFHFTTVDNRYNYFRGWIVDDVRVTNQPALGSASSLQVQRAPFRAPPQPCGARCERSR